MPLAMEGTRVLSPLERDAVNLVFQDTIDPWDISLTVVEQLERQVTNRLLVTQPWGAIKRKVSSTYEGNGKIKINRSAFRHAQALNINSTRSYIDLTDKRGERTNPFRPANMHYLSTLIHECTHYWQEVYGRHGPPVSHVNTLYQSTNYRFTAEQLSKRDVPELLSEQHASAAQVYFLIDWQLRYQPKGSNVYLTSQSIDPKHNVGPVDHFHEFDGLFTNSGNGISRIVKYKDVHRLIYDYFGWLLVELRYGWKAVCQGKESFPRKKRAG